MAERGSEARDGETEVGEFEELEGELGFDVYGEVEDAVVEVVALAVALHHVGELWAVDIMDLVDCELA